MDELQNLIERIGRKEYGQNYNPGYYEVRPILPEDVGLKTWMWYENDIKICPTNVHLVLFGIQCQLLLQVTFRRPISGNIVAIATTGQPFYTPYYWEKLKELTVHFGYLEKPPSQSIQYIAFSFLGFAVEPIGSLVEP